MKRKFLIFLIFSSLSASSTNQMFIGLSAGGVKLNIDEKNTNGNIVLRSKPTDIGYSYGVEAGYYFEKKIFMTINYEALELDTTYFRSAFSSINYKFVEINRISSYFGILGGYNIIYWKKNPLTSSNTKAYSSSLMVGFQIGVEQEINRGLALYGFYRYSVMDHISNITSDSNEKELNHNNEQTINFGIKYNF